MIKIFLAIFFLSLSSKIALPHSWYASECCSGQDCKVVSDDDVEELKDGKWRYKPLNIIFDKAKVKPTQDNFYHVCYLETDNTPRCIYIKLNS